MFYWSETESNIGLQPPNNDKSNQDKLPRPIIEEGIGESDWNYFVKKWNGSLKNSGLIDQLWLCASPGYARTLVSVTFVPRKS